MRPYLKPVYKVLSFIKFDLVRTLVVLKHLPSHYRDFQTLKTQQKTSSLSFPFGKWDPCLFDGLGQSGVAGGHYFHQDLLVASKIFLNHPDVHVDVGSRIDGFVAHVASFREIEVVDIRHLTPKIKNVKFRRLNMMNDMPPDFTDYCDSLSCLHVLEHFGLGRYGDPMNFEGHVAGFNNLSSLLKRHGKLYLSVPIGPQRIEFNAHRVFSLRYLLELFESKYKVDSFSYVDDKGCLFEDVELAPDEIEKNLGCFFGCGIFELTKL